MKHIEPNRFIVKIIVRLITFLTAFIIHAQDPQSEFLLDNFDHGEVQGYYKNRTNFLGHYQGSFANRPSFTILTKTSIFRRGNKGSALALRYKKSGGWCGWYTLLGGIDVQEYSALSFWVKGNEGGESFNIGFQDQIMVDRSIDAQYIGNVNTFLPSGVTTHWQEVQVPYHALENKVNLRELGSVVFLFREPGSSTIYIDDMKLIKLSGDKLAILTTQQVAKANDANITTVKTDRGLQLPTPAIDPAIAYPESMKSRSSVSLRSGRLYRIPEAPELIDGDQLTAMQKMTAKRGKYSNFGIKPSQCKASKSSREYFEHKSNIITNGANFRLNTTDEKCMQMDYLKVEDKSFCGVYYIMLADLSAYKTMTFLVKGAKGGEAFEIAIADVVSSQRGDSVLSGSIYRYLPEGVTSDWQVVKIPLTDFYGTNLHNTYSLLFRFNEPGKGTLYIDEIRFTSDILVDRKSDIAAKGYLILDDFNHSNLNLRGCFNSVYDHLPSMSFMQRVDRLDDAGKNQCLQLQYDKKKEGWTGYFSLFNQLGTGYYDLSKFTHLTFLVKGEKGGELFELKMADRSSLEEGNSVSGGNIEDFLEHGVTTEWQEVRIPLSKFQSLDFKQMGSFVINFNRVDKGTVFVDDVFFYLQNTDM